MPSPMMPMPMKPVAMVAAPWLGFALRMDYEPLWLAALATARLLLASCRIAQLPSSDAMLDAPLRRVLTGADTQQLLGMLLRTLIRSLTAR